MKWWVWIGCIVVFAFASRQVWRAFTIGKVYARGAYFTRSAYPVTFWFLVMLYGIGAILFGGGMVVVLASDLGLISN